LNSYSIECCYFGASGGTDNNTKIIGLRQRIKCSERYADWTSLAMAQMKPASSRAMAVTVTVNFLPRCDSAR
jgi:hypothetical protein